MHTAGRFTLLRPHDHPTAIRGLRVLVGGPETHTHRGGPREADTESRVANFLTYAEHAGIDIQRQILALEVGPDGSASRVAGMCLWVPAPGRTAMLFGPSQSEFPQSASATAAAVMGALDGARLDNVSLVQALVEPADAAGKTVFAAAGLSTLATLTYMERKPPAPTPTHALAPAADALPPDLREERWSPSAADLFRDAILASYEQTLDCPALSGLRSVEDILEGHRAVGPFDPGLWTVIHSSGKAVGCLLLSEIPARHALELVYLGLAPSIRGRGIGRILVRRTLAAASARRSEIATLAVDAANAPAVRLYRRAGYASVAQRVALIKKL